ncbi:low temperature requirement protein A [Micromonospora fulviviridis]|uniref:low temperature requirement protein A n=1 Tax=Micromonospora fulviviridis TaxID=47860 RepID=UPI0037A2DBD1
MPAGGHVPSGRRGRPEHVVHSRQVSELLREHEAKRALYTRQAIGFTASGVFWLAGAVTEGPYRVALWSLAITVDLAVAYLNWPVPRHAPMAYQRRSTAADRQPIPVDLVNARRPAGARRLRPGQRLDQRPPGVGQVRGIATLTRHGDYGPTAR